MDFDESRHDDEINGEPAGKPKASKGWKITKKILKIVSILLICTVWAVIFLTLILRSDDDILETPILSDEARELYKADKGNFVIYKVYPSDFMSKDGSIQLSTAVYSETAHEFEIGVRIAWTQLRYCEECDTVYTPAQLEQQLKDDAENAKDNEYYMPTACLTVHNVIRASLKDMKLYYTLTDSQGNVYAEANRESRVKSFSLFSFSMKYEYERVSFSGLYFDLENNIINTAADENLSEDISEGETSSGVKYYLNVYDKKGGNLLYSSCIYSNDTYIDRTSFKYPDNEYVKS